MNWSDQSSSTRRRYLQIAEDLLLAISTGELAAGSKLPPEREIALKYEVSRSTVRDAILALELTGAITVQHGSGNFVRGPELGGNEWFSGLEIHPQQLLEARAEIEPAVIAMLSNSIADDTIISLKHDLEETSAIVGDDSRVGRFTEINFRFHSVLAAECPNIVLRKVTSDLVNTQLHPLWNLINQQASRTREAREHQNEEHLRILKALEDRDSTAARTAMQEHIQGMIQAFLPFPHHH